MIVLRGFALDLIAAGIGEIIAQNIVAEAFLEAIETMKLMPANEGQSVVYTEYVLPAFKLQFELQGPDAGEEMWNDVDIGVYMDFMGEIVEEGNKIMEEAFLLAYKVKDSIQDAAGLIGGPPGMLESLGEAVSEMAEFGEDAAAWL
jgi:hypothetical protein